MTLSKAMISLEDVTIAYDRHPVVHHISGHFLQGSLTALVGPNGAGKSSLIKAIAGLIQPSSGSINFIHCSLKDIGYLPQLNLIEDSIPISVLDVVLLGYWRTIGAFGAVHKQMIEQAEVALDRVGLQGHYHRLFSTLSSGQKQRTLFARLMIAHSKIILLDEPFSSIDSQTTEDLLLLIQQWNQEGKTIIAVLHDITQVKKFFSETLLLARHRIAWGPSQSCLTSENLRKAGAISMAWGPSDDEICDGVL